MYPFTYSRLANIYRQGPYLFDGINSKVNGTPCFQKQANVNCTQLEPKTFKNKPDNRLLKTIGLITGVAVATYTCRKPIGKVLAAISSNNEKTATSFKNKYPNFAAAIENGPIGVVSRFLSRTPRT
ncbi:hypothetical protein IJ182_08370 [bacterium]|nr:hypothetical protein [bacterium]